MARGSCNGPTLPKPPHSRFAAPKRECGELQWPYALQPAAPPTRLTRQPAATLPHPAGMPRLTQQRRCALLLCMLALLAHRASAQGEWPGVLAAAAGVRQRLLGANSRGRSGGWRGCGSSLPLA